MPSLCGICGSSLQNYLRDGRFGYLRGSGCRHVVLDPVPTEAELKEFYTTGNSELWNSGAFAILQDYVSNPDVVRQYYWRDRLRHIQREFPNALQRNTAALDVGCSSGVFVAALQDLGLNASGQDIAGPAVEAGV
jgi:2-polyprenyl-3-methyl-5-hydroxy-6-metoxy-1,4-benzoquinol methylase